VRAESGECSRENKRERGVAMAAAARAAAASAAKRAGS